MRKGGEIGHPLYLVRGKWMTPAEAMRAEPAETKAALDAELKERMLFTLTFAALANAWYRYQMGWLDPHV